MYFFSTSHLAITSSLLFLLSPTSVVALPKDKSDVFASGKSNCALDPELALPPTTLTQPSKGLKLVEVMVGKGKQVYKCSSAGSKPRYLTTQADLYDASCLVGNRKALRIFSDELIPNLLYTTEKQTKDILNHNGPQTSLDNLFLDRLGRTLLLLNSDMRALLDWAENSPAPSDAQPNKWGPAIDWQRLVRGSDSSKRGIDEVYRLHTAGGHAPPKCKNKDKIEVEYVASYWIYG